MCVGGGEPEAGGPGASAHGRGVCRPGACFQGNFLRKWAYNDAISCILARFADETKSSHLTVFALERYHKSTVGNIFYFIN